MSPVRDHNVGLITGNENATDALARPISNGMRGMTLIEAMFSVAIFLIVVFGTFEAYRALGLSISAAEQKLSALEVANERLEIGRATRYADLLTLGGSQTVSRSGYTFNLGTSIVNMDDSFDGLAPTDSDPIDYRLMKVEVSCVSCRNFVPVRLTGRFAP